MIYNKIVDSREYRGFVWTEANTYLKELVDKVDDENVDWDSVQEFLENQPRFTNLKQIFHRLIGSLTNRRNMGATIGNINEMTSILCDFNHLKLLDKYGSNVDVDWGHLFDEIWKDEKHLMNTSVDKNNPKNFWVQFCKGVLSCAMFFKEHGFRTSDDFYQYVEDFINGSDANRLLLPFVIGEHIKGIGFALACDFLKEVGCTQFAKPDTHLLTIFSKVKLCLGIQTEVFRTVMIMEQELGVTAFAIDKVFWMIGANELHYWEDADARKGANHEDFGSKRKVFIDRVNKEWMKKSR